MKCKPAVGAATDPRRRYVRRLTLKRANDEDLIVVTDLLNASRYPAVDVLAVYHGRWGIETVFQTVTEVFPLKRLIGSTPQAGIFQMAFCLLLYNMIHVLRAYIAAAADWEAADVSLEKLFDDVEQELIAWTVEAPASRRHFKHCTWKSMILSREDLSRCPERIPRLNRTGLARKIVLAYCGGARTRKEIEQAVLGEHPHMFPSREEIIRFVQRELSRDTE